MIKVESFSFQDLRDEVNSRSLKDDEVILCTQSRQFMKVRPRPFDSLHMPTMCKRLGYGVTVRCSMIYGVQSGHLYKNQYVSEPQLEHIIQRLAEADSTPIGYRVRTLDPYNVRGMKLLAGYRSLDGRIHVGMVDTSDDAFKRGLVEWAEPIPGET